MGTEMRSGVADRSAEVARRCAWCGRVALGVGGIAHRLRSRSMSCPESRGHAARHGVRPKRLKAELPTGRGPDAPVAAARFGVLPMPPRRGEVTDGRQPVPTIVGRVRGSRSGDFHDPEVADDLRDLRLLGGRARTRRRGRCSASAPLAPTSSGTPTGIFPPSSSTDRHFQSHPRRGRCLHGTRRSRM